jgi:AraC-like DNA-binding protein
MQSVFRHIENNIPNDLDTELLKNVGYVSCAQLYRDFYSIAGHTAKEYVRKRRLSNALALIKTSDIGLTDIAFQCGYSSHQSLCRAVRQILGITPSEYKNSDTYYFFPPWSGEPLQSVTVSCETIPRALRVLFYHSSLTNIENIAVNTFLQAFPDYNGRIFGRNGEQVESKLCYELYLTDVGRDYNKLNTYGFKITYEISCSTATFAKSTVQNNEQKINAAWDYLYSEWLQNSMFEYTNEPYYEEYILKNGKPAKLKLYLPIQKRNGDTKITLIKNPELHFIVSEAKGFNAEKIASRTVIDWLTTYYPYIVRTSKEFYLRKETDSYICGVCVKSELQITNAENIKSIDTDKNNYLVLESPVSGDYDRYADMLLIFARDNGMTADKTGIFAVYDATESFDNPRIKMYYPVKIEKN